jgi:membrane associated rhomboid family serine protease
MKEFLLKHYRSPLLIAFILPIIIGIWMPKTLLFFQSMVWVLVFFLPLFAAAKVFVDWTLHEKSFVSSVFKNVLFLPGGVVYSTDLKNKGVPLVTLGLLLINIAIFYLAPENFKERYCFTPMDNAPSYRIIASFFVSAFLHANTDHLFGNMIFLWVFGSTLESRLGSRKVLGLYSAFIVISELFSLLLLFFRNDLQFTGLLDDYHGLGASGAIAGLMGVFVIRCYYARVKVSVPIFILPVGAIPIKVHGLIFMALFFAIQVDGSEYQYAFNGHINYWAHAGGYSAGILLGYLLTTKEDTKAEVLEVKAKKLSRDPLDRDDLKAVKKDILKNNPNNEQALIDLIHLHRWNDDDKARYYVPLMELYLNSDMKKADALFTEQSGLEKHLSEQSLFKLGSYFYRKYKLSDASRCLELAAAEKGPLRPKILLILAKTYKAIGNDAMAEKVLKYLIKTSDDKLFTDEAKRLLQLS